MKYFILIIVTCQLAVSTSFAQSDWMVPKDQKEKLSTARFNDIMQESGEAIYKKSCTTCHGIPGMKNFNPALVPSPGDPAADKFQSNTDGEFFYKIKEGRAIMPSFKNAMSNNDIWNVIAYLRSFNPKYVQETSEKIIANIPEGTILSLAMQYLGDKNAIEVDLSGKKEDDEFPVGGVGIQLMVKRYFGNLQIGEIKSTDNEGKALFIWNSEIPGDSIGNVELIAQFEDPDIYGEIVKKQAFQIGISTSKPPLNKDRAMWNTFKKAPYWILLGYFGAVSSVWFFIFYVLFQLRKISKAGKDQIINEESVL